MGPIRTYSDWRAQDRYTSVRCSPAAAAFARVRRLVGLKVFEGVQRAKGIRSG
jgi:hypothetical protein